MAFTYFELKEAERNREQAFRDNYYNFFTIFEEYYNPEKIKFVYIKNFFNDDETETILLYEDKIIRATKKELHYQFEENRNKVVNKSFYISKDCERETRLTITFDNDDAITFDNYKDSNVSWAWEYGQDIKELYKLL